MTDRSSEKDSVAVAEAPLVASVRIGGSRDPARARGTRLTLQIPPREQLSKCEDRVVGWNERLADGTLAFVKLYLRRPRTIAREGVRTTVRACREFDQLQRLYDAGIHCTAPLFWGWGATERLGRVEVLATRLVNDSQTLRDAIRERESVIEEFAWRDLLSSVDAMHAAGIHHGGLSTKNILLDAKGGFYLCDLAKSMFYPTSIIGSRMALFDLVHFFHGLGKLIGSERRDEILRDGRSPELAEQVMRKAATYKRRSRIQHLRLRSEFHLRNIWAWQQSGGRAKPPLRSGAW
jgi:serine/threonine-protein kinase RIO1